MSPLLLRSGGSFGEFSMDNWIDVTDQLPEGESAVLLMIDWFDDVQAGTFVVNGKQSWFQMEYEGKTFMFPTREYHPAVSHWMPFPDKREV